MSENRSKWSYNSKSSRFSSKLIPKITVSVKRKTYKDYFKKLEMHKNCKIYKYL